MATLVEQAGAARVGGVVLDIGVSSMQLDRAERGFSIQADGPLDMRMAQAGMTAADFLNSAPEEEIADVLYRYGEEPRSLAALPVPSSLRGRLRERASLRAWCAVRWAISPMTRRTRPRGPFRRSAST